MTRRFVTMVLLSILCLHARPSLGEAPATQPAKDAAPPQAQSAPAPLSFTMTDLAGDEVSLGKYRGKVVLIVNTASKCGLTPQYKALQAMHEKYGEQGLAILGFPANDFKNQEPLSNTQIAEFCQTNYGVTFDMFAKIAVTGPDKHPLYKVLTETRNDHVAPGEIRWNFEKFLLDRNGEIVHRFAPKITPDAEEVVSAIETELAKTGDAP